MRDGGRLVLLAFLAGCATTPAPAPKSAAPPHETCAILECVTILASHGIMSWGCPEAPDTLRMDWTLPEDGSPVVLYVYELRIFGTAPEPPAWIYISASVDSLQGHCYGIDGNGNGGPWSLWSEWWRR